MAAIRITILARIPLIRQGLRALLADEPDFAVTLLAPSEDWLDDLHTEHAEVLLLDVQVLEQEGWDILNEMRRALPTLTILILGDNPQDQRVSQAFRFGARGYLLRDASAQEMASAVRAAYNGTLVLHPQLATRLFDALEHAKENERRANGEGGGELIEPLSARELDVLRLMTRGLANKQIAGELFITEHTVKFHIRAILGKLGAANRTEAVTLALQNGLVSL